MIDGFCGQLPAHEPHEWRFLRCGGVPPSEEADVHEDGYCDTCDEAGLNTYHGGMW